MFSLNSTHKTPVSMSTVERRLRDADLLGRVAKTKPYLRLANKNKRLSWAKEHRCWTEEFTATGLIHSPPKVNNVLTCSNLALICPPEGPRDKM